MRFLNSPLLARLLRNGFWGLLGTGAGRVLNLIAMTLLAREISLVQFGYFALIQATLGMFGVFAGAGIGSTATRFIAQFRLTDPCRTGRILGMVQALSYGLVLVMLLAIVGLAEPIAQMLEADDGTDLRLAVTAGAAFLAVSSMRSVQDAILAGFESFRDIGILKLIEGLAIVLIMPWLAALHGIEGALVGMALGSGFTLLAGTVLSLRKLRAATIRINWAGMLHETGILISYSLPSILSQLMGTPVIWFGVWLLSRQPKGVAETALYNAAFQWHGPLILVPMILISVSIPILVQLWAADERGRFLKLLGLLLLVGVLLSGLPALMVALLRKPIMLSYGNAFLSGQSILVLLVLAAPVHTLANIGTTALESMNRAWLVLATSGLWAAVFALLCSIFVPSLGAHGLATSFLGAYAAQALVRNALAIAIAVRR